LHEDILDANLPETQGFFFGSDSRYDDSRLASDLRFISQAKEHLEAGMEIAYDSWW